MGWMDSPAMLRRASDPGRCLVTTPIRDPLYTMAYRRRCQYMVRSRVACRPRADERRSAPHRPARLRPGQQHRERPVRPLHDPHAPGLLLQLPQGPPALLNVQLQGRLGLDPALDPPPTAPCEHASATFPNLPQSAELAQRFGATRLPIGHIGQEQNYVGGFGKQVDVCNYLHRTPNITGLPTFRSSSCWCQHELNPLRNSAFPRRTRRSG